MKSIARIWETAEFRTKNNKKNRQKKTHIQKKQKQKQKKEKNKQTLIPGQRYSYLGVLL